MPIASKSSGWGAKTRRRKILGNAQVLSDRAFRRITMPALSIGQIMFTEINITATEVKIKPLDDRLELRGFAPIGIMECWNILDRITGLT